MKDTLPFDRVVIRDQGHVRACDVDQFLALPLHLRVRIILQRDIDFFSGEEPVDRGVALKSLRQELPPTMSRHRR